MKHRDHNGTANTKKKTRLQHVSNQAACSSRFYQLHRIVKTGHQCMKFTTSTGATSFKNYCISQAVKLPLNASWDAHQCTHLALRLTWWVDCVASSYSAVMHHRSGELPTTDFKSICMHSSGLKSTHSGSLVYKVICVEIYNTTINLRRAK